MARALLGLATACTGGDRSLSRVVDGELVVGRMIDPAAYSAYAQAALLEARGRWRESLEHYERALENDRNSPEILTRIGAVLCRLGDQVRAQAAFRAAADFDPSYAPRLREQARCELEQGRARSAVELATRAVELDPEDSGASELVIEAYLAAGDPDSAERWRRGLRSFRRRVGLEAPCREPSPRGLEAWLPVGTGHRDEPGAAARPGRVERLGVLDRTLEQGRLQQARRLAQALRLQPAALALRAVALGRADLGWEQAWLILRADPSNGDAWVAALEAADLLRDESGFEQALGALDTEATLAQPLARMLLAELLARRVGLEAAGAWLLATGVPQHTDDPLEARICDRLRSSGLGGLPLLEQGEKNQVFSRPSPESKTR